ncbi:MAG: LPS export ABC transporter permease LptG [Nevskiales bacterium]
MKTLNFYLMRNILAASLMVAMILLVISAFTSLLAEFDNVSGAYGALQAVQFVMLKLPESLYLLLPTIMLIGTLMGLGALAAGSELTVMRASGLSLLQLGATSAQAGLLAGIFTYALGDYVVPPTFSTAHGMRTEARFGEVTNPAQQGVWLREANRYIHIGRIYAENTVGDVRIYAFDDAHRITGTLAAERAHYDGERWQLDMVHMSTLEDQRIHAKFYPKMEWPVTIDPGLLRLSVVRPEALSSTGLLHYARYLDKNGLDASPYWSSFWRKLAVPLTAIVMTLVAVPFVLGSQRGGGAGQRLFLGIMLGVGFYLLNEIVQNSGQVYGLPPWLTALLPTVLAGGAALGWLQRTR